MSNGLGGLNKSPNGVVVGVVQLGLPVVSTPAELAAQTDKIVWMVGKARRNLGTMDLVDRLGRRPRSAPPPTV